MVCLKPAKRYIIKPTGELSKVEPEAPPSEKIKQRKKMIGRIIVDEEGGGERAALRIRWLVGDSKFLTPKTAERFVKSRDVA